MLQYSRTVFKKMSNNVENPGSRVFDPAKAVSADISQGGDVNKHKGSVNSNELVNPPHTVCADLNQGNESVFGSNAGKQCVTDLIYISQGIDIFMIALQS